MAGSLGAGPIAMLEAVDAGNPSFVRHLRGRQTGKAAQSSWRIDGAYLTHKWRTNGA
jgi:hypothetical protein